MHGSIHMFVRAETFLPFAQVEQGKIGLQKLQFENKQ